MFFIVMMMKYLSGISSAENYENLPCLSRNQVNSLLIDFLLFLKFYINISR